MTGQTVENISKLIRETGQDKAMIEVAAVYSDYIAVNNSEIKIKQPNKDFYKQEIDTYLDYIKSNIVYSYSPTHLKKFFISKFYKLYGSKSSSYRYMFEK